MSKRDSFWRLALIQAGLWQYILFVCSNWSLKSSWKRMNRSIAKPFLVCFFYDSELYSWLWSLISPCCSGQSQVCTLGETCTITGLRGLGLSVTDKVTPLTDCYPTWGLTQTFTTWPPPQFPISVDSEGGYQIEMGVPPLEGYSEAIQLCWCGLTDFAQCVDTWEYGAVAMTVNLACAAGWYELAPGLDKRCKPCMNSYYCQGLGWKQAMNVYACLC